LNKAIDLVYNSSVFSIVCKRALMSLMDSSTTT
jgi:hypothetical protein